MMKEWFTAEVRRIAAEAGLYEDKWSYFYKSDALPDVFKITPIALTPDSTEPWGKLAEGDVLIGRAYASHGSVSQIQLAGEF